jgi:hypothetical protein
MQISAKIIQAIRRVPTMGWEAETVVAVVPTVTRSESVAVYDVGKKTGFSRLTAIRVTSTEAVEVRAGEALSLAMTVSRNVTGSDGREKSVVVVMMPVPALMAKRSVDGVTAAMEYVRGLSLPKAVVTAETPTTGEARGALARSWAV